MAGVMIIMFLGSVIEKVTKKRKDKMELAVLEQLLSSERSFKVEF